MSNRYARILAAGGAAVLVAAMGVPVALAAATTWTIQPGGAVHAKSGLFTLKDVTTGTVMACRPSTGFPLTARGTLKSGSGLPGSHAGLLSAASFGRCAGPGVPLFARQTGSLSPRFIVTLQARGLPWHVNLSSYNAANGVVRGTLSHLQITGSANGCTFVVDGTSGTAEDGRVAFRYTDSTGQLTVLTTGGNLHVYDVSTGCLGLVNDGDPAALGVTYTVTPKQAITSP
jgi:hypothetical protein